MRMQILKVLVLGSLLTVAGACRKDKDKETDDAVAKNPTIDPVVWKQKQTAFADSVLGATPNAKKVAEKLGTKYEVGSVALRDTIAVLARDPKQNCFGKGKAVDPFLAGTVSVWVNMSVIGSDVVRVQESKWTTAAGEVVDGCLTEAMKSWKFSTALGAPNAYIVQVQFR